MISLSSKRLIEKEKINNRILKRGKYKGLKIEVLINELEKLRDTSYITIKDSNIKNLGINFKKISFILCMGKVSIYSKALFFLSDSKVDVPKTMEDINTISQIKKTAISI